MSLKLTVNAKALRTGVSAVARAVSGRSSLQILNSILMKSEESGIRLIATDLELGISCSVNCELQSEGSVAVPAKPIVELLSNVPDGDDIVLDVMPNNQVRIKCGKRGVHKLLHDPNDYPLVPKGEDGIKFAVPQRVLKSMIEHVIDCASFDKSAKPTLQGVILNVANSVLNVVATDLYTLGYESYDLPAEVEDCGAVFPIIAMQELCRLFTESEEDVQITLCPATAHFSIPSEGSIELATKLIQGECVNYKRVIAKEFPIHIVLPTDSLLVSLRRMLITARDSSNKLFLSFCNGTCTATSESHTVGDSLEEVDCDYEGDELQLAYNIQFLSRVLKNIKTENVVLHAQQAEHIKDQKGEPTRELDWFCYARIP